MQIINTPIPDLLIIAPKVFYDERGYFFESFNAANFQAQGLNFSFVQDNESQSAKGTIRGLHFQHPPYAQGKLVRVVQGAVLDVAVDLRLSSPTYGRWYSVVLSAENKKQYFIPPGFAHGFKTLDDNTIFTYKCTAPYHKASEGSIQWDDPYLNIDWELNGTPPILSDKDKKAPAFLNFDSPFE